MEAPLARVSNGQAQWKIVLTQLTSNSSPHSGEYALFLYERKNRVSSKKLR
jgi:hypothetical protein